MLPFKKPIVIVDLETTGGSPSFHRIIEVAAIRIEPGTGAETVYQSFVNPGRRIPEMIQRLTGISNEDVARAPAFDEIAIELRDFLEGAVFVAHNARFDYSFLKHHFESIGMLSGGDALQRAFSKKVYPAHRYHNLNAIIERYGFSVKNRHRALDDARAVADFFEYAVRDKGELAFFDAVSQLMKGRLAQTGLGEDALQEVPEACGVYRFRGEQDELLYIGKSRNMRQRVRSHYYEDHASRRRLEMTSKIRRVETLRTPGEFSALILESELVKKEQPLYNRRLRLNSAPVFALRVPGPGGYDTIEYTRDISFGETAPEDVMGVFHSLKKAKETLAEIGFARGLCPKMLGIEKSPRACFSYHLGKCRGPAPAKKAALYNARQLLALEPTALRAWPYKGAVLLTETSVPGTARSYVVDQWCLLAEIREEDGAVEKRLFEARFDPDVYKLLCRFISKRPKGLKIQKLGQRDNEVRSTKYEIRSAK